MLTSWCFSQVAVTFARFFSSSTAFCRTVCNLLVSSVFSPEKNYKTQWYYHWSAQKNDTIINKNNNEQEVLSCLSYAAVGIVYNL